MSQCTHIIVFNHTQPLNLPSEISTFPQIHVVSELWLESCLRSKNLVDDTPYLLQPVNTEDGRVQSAGLIVVAVSFQLQTTRYIFEWENDIRASVDNLFDGCTSDYSTAFSVYSRPFLHF